MSECHACKQQSLRRCLKTSTNLLISPTVFASHTYPKPCLYKSAFICEAHVSFPASDNDLSIL